MITVLRGGLKDSAPPRSPTRSAVASPKLTLPPGSFPVFRSPDQTNFTLQPFNPSKVQFSVMALACFLFFAYCGLVVEIQPFNCQNLRIVAPLPTSTKGKAWNPMKTFRFILTSFASFEAAQAELHLADGVLLSIDPTKAPGGFQKPFATERGTQKKVGRKT